jgi:putative NIF3 family GTP cyclohydrolase 1 type 2
MTTAKEIANAIAEIAPLNSGVPGDQLGLIYGRPGQRVRGIGCMWNVHVPSIRACIKQKLDMIVCHEALFLPPQKSPWYQGPAEKDIFSNLERATLLKKHGMEIGRAHV